MSQITSPVILDSTGVRIAEAIEALSGGGGGGGSSDIYTSTFKIIFAETDNDEVVALLPAVKFITAFAPITTSNLIPSDKTDVIVPVALAVLQGENTCSNLTIAQAAHLNNTPDPTSLNFFIYTDPNASPVGYGLTNIKLHIGSNVYIFDFDNEMFALQGTYIQVNDQSEVYLEIDQVGDFIQIYDV